MTRHVELVYENGMLRPTVPLDLPEGKQLRLYFLDDTDDPEIASLFVSPEEFAEWADCTVTLEEVRQALSEIPGCMSDVISAEREDRF